LTVRGHVQAYNLGAKITLFEFDLTMFGLGVIRLTPGTTGSVAISFGDEMYAPHPIKADGFEMAAGGSMPRPTIMVANLDNSFTALVEQEDDLHGGIVRRIRTYDRYLDSGAEPDGDQHLPIDVYELSLKTDHSPEQIAWQMVARMDQEGVELPGRTIVRDYCDHDTRVWDPDTAAFDYTLATCPYVGDPKDVNGLPCAAAAEVFSKKLETCCIARFGAGAVLPTRAFPGVARLRTR
jgi:lambda family phage minor tail protein L